MKALTISLGLFILLGTAAPSEARQATIDSLYTGLAEADCRVLRVNEEEGWSESRCEGVAGYALNLMDGDARQTLDILTPDGKAHPLNLWSVVSGAFSTLGPKAEWRVRKEKGQWQPFALIVRFNASENPEDATKITSYLVVSKITAGEVCVTDVVPPQAKANEMARELADASGGKACKEPPH